MTLRLLLSLLLFVAHGVTYAIGKDVALITRLQGQVMRIVKTVDAGKVTQSAQRQFLQVYFKLKLATPDAIASIGNTYRRLRDESPDRSDLNPELYLLSGMYEMRELRRVGQVLSDLQRERGSEPQVKILVSLYQRPMKNSREFHGN